MPNPPLNNPKQKRYLGQGAIPGTESVSSLDSVLAPNPNMNSQRQRPREDEGDRYKHAMRTGGGIAGQGRPDTYSRGRSSRRELPSLGGFGNGAGENTIQSLIENRLRKRKKFELPQAAPTQDRMLSRYLGGGM